MRGTQGAPEAMEGALAEKVDAAERGIALLRVLVVATGCISYPLLDKAGTNPREVYPLLGLLALYSLAVFLLEPYRKYPVLPLAVGTSLSDALGTLGWLCVTGGIHSPYGPMPLLLVTTVGIRFTPRATLIAAGSFMGAYLALLLGLGQLVDHLPMVLIHVFFILIAGVLGRLVSWLVLEQLVAKRELQKRLRMEERLSSSEAALAEAQAIAHLGSWSWEFSTRQLTWSAELFRILGLAPGGTARHEDFLASIHPEERQAVHQMLMRAWEERQPFHGEYRLLRPSGEVRWVHFQGQAVLDASGQPVRVSGTLQDITERKLMETRLMMTDRMAALGTLAGGIAHEINNPLTFITNNLSYLEESLDSAEAKQLPSLEEFKGAVSDAREGANRVRHIVRDLKAFSRVEEARLEPIDVHQGLEFALNVAAHEIRPRAQVVRDFEPIPSVLGDETRLGQVFLNLLVNAAQAIPEGHPEANILTVRTRAGEGGQVFVEIRDTGVGIPPEIRERIFEPFFTTKPAGVGTGLGLPICQRIVTSLGGKISVQSEVGRGTTFTVTLPGIEAPRVVQPEVAPVALSPVRARVLVVDDEPMLAASLSRSLRSEYDVTTSSGSEALRRLLAGEDPDVIVCDLAMPDITGMDLYSRLKEQRPALAARMIFLTGGAFTQRAQDFLDQAQYWLEKPVELPALRTLLQEVVEQSPVVYTQANSAR
ncbi:ATP-binding protein [Hyalangium sp.]|uniref:hybrid sensor histidine kinase/response regulator n=1 Tax=Hyalangium sp. TaxID=2028555 RepID=UPI00389AF642